jgi:ferredoxin
MIERDDDLCVDCGACAGQCAPGALAPEPGTFEIRFRAELCAGCDLCLDACGYGALRPAPILRTGTGGP